MPRLCAPKSLVALFCLTALVACGDPEISVGPPLDTVAESGTDAAAADAAADDAGDSAADAVGNDVAAADAVTADTLPADVTADDVTVADAVDAQADDTADAVADATPGEDAAADAVDASTGGDTVGGGDSADTSDAPDVGPTSCTTAAQCDDGAACTGDLCVAGKCAHVTLPGCTGPLTPCDAGHPCADGVCDPTRHACVACVTADDCGGGAICAGNACVPSTPCKSDIDCKAQNLVCAKGAGACVACTVSADCGKGEACVEFACVPEVPCSTSKDCAAVCDIAAGKCVGCVDSTDCAGGQTCNNLHTCVPATCVETTCLNGTAFTCEGGGWSYGVAQDCTDDSACTSDVCANGSGCGHTFNTSACNDGNACTIGDQCAGGACSGTDVVCDDGKPCTVDLCDAVTGCVAQPNSGPCNDGNACTGFDTCVQGVCAGVDVSCNDQNGCTTDSCSPTDGCRNIALVGIPCEDGDACTVGTVCGDKQCAGGKALDCDDGNVCTVDTCAKVGGCQYAANGGAACDDGNACTTPDVCGGKTGKVCTGTTLTCADGNVCTTDSCDPASGCVFTANTLECSDGNPCTWPDVCQAQACVGQKNASCDDGITCTADACDGHGGCTHVGLSGGEPCSDGDLCTVGDGCAAGACVGKAKDCSDNNACTTDTCVAGLCKWTNNTAPCDDSNGCTLNDVCTGGVCVSGKAVDCVADTHGCGGGQCVALSNTAWKCTVNAQPNGTACDADGSGCTVGDACQNGQCAPGPTKDCTGATSPDGCQVGTCASTGPTTAQCVATPAAAKTPCNADSNGCTQADACDGQGACVPGTPVTCVQEPTSCLVTTCVSTGTSLYQCAGGAPRANGSGCSADNNGCTQDMCAGGVCTPGPAVDCSGSADACHTAACISGGALNYVCVASPITCNDGNPCTDDACQVATGCTATPNQAGCFDGNVCTLSDTCNGGTCAPGLPADCDDKNTCTVDTCDPIVGCMHKAIDCSDGKICTLDQCDPVGGCAHTAVPACVDTSLPYFQSFACGAATGWTLGTTAEPGVAWAVDATPAAPVAYSAGCALNFNNGIDYSCTNPLNSSAVSPPFDATKLAVGTHLSMSFMVAGIWESGTWDNLYVEATTDQGQTWSSLLNPAPQTTMVWARQTVDLTSLVGKVFALRFRFATVDCLYNQTSGPFVDDVALYLTSCAADSDCQDQNICTSDSCQKALGTCLFSPNSSACSDGSACTGPEACAAGVCAGNGVVTCDDGNACTLDLCNPVNGACSNTAVATGTTCDDGSPCTVSDACKAGFCVGGSTSACDDGNPCTVDTCTIVSAAASCTYAAVTNGTPCSDGNACTKPDACSAGLCTGKDTCTYTSALSETFNCGTGAGWTLPVNAGTAVKWAIDATPAAPGYYSASCALNLNDGTTYGTTDALNTSATSPAFTIDANASVCVLSFYSYSGLSMSNAETRSVALRDATTGADLLARPVNSGDDNLAWKQLSFDCTPAIGHTVKLEFRFSDTAAVFFPATGVGWFVDDAKVTIGK